MAETIQKGIETGETREIVNADFEAVFIVLYDRFESVPKQMLDEIYKITDPIAFDSLLILAATCKSIDEIANALKQLLIIQTKNEPTS